MGIYYGEQSGKGYKAKLNVTEEELEKYLESLVHYEDLLGVLMLLPRSYSRYSIQLAKRRKTTSHLL